MLSWRRSHRLRPDFCLDAVQEAITRDGPSASFNANRGCQFMSVKFTGLLKDHGIQMRLDGTGCGRDTVFV